MALTNGQDADANDFLNEALADLTDHAQNAGKGVRTESDGKLSPHFIRRIFGNGADGDVTISSPTTLTRDMYYNNLVVNSTLTTNGYRIYVANQISGTGTIDWGTPNNGGGGGVNINGGSAGAQSGSGFLKNTAGAIGGNDDGNPTTPVSGSLGPAGATGGTGEAGTGAVAGAAANNLGALVTTLGTMALLGGYFDSTGVLQPLRPNGSSGGERTGNGGSTSTLGGGGGSGATGGLVLIAAKKWTGTFTIKSNGGNGGAGGTGSNGDGGGGAGGNGGNAIVVYDVKTWTGSFNLAGGTGGAAGGTGASAGSNGNTGVSFEIHAGQLV